GLGRARDRRRRTRSLRAERTLLPDATLGSFRFVRGGFGVRHGPEPPLQTPRRSRMRQKIAALSLLSGCVLPAEERVSLDRKVGRAEAAELSVEVLDGLAAVRSLDETRLELWAQAPTLTLQVEGASSEPRPYRLDVYNCMQGAVLRMGD